jgi:beta-lactamase regulating signal transducer with metallopeptidase domain
VSTNLLLEAALRSLVMGAIILVALRLLRIEQVRARRTAWLLALAGALAMPLLVAAQVGPRLLPEISLAAQTETKAPIDTNTAQLRSAARGTLRVPQAGAPDSHWVDHGSSIEESAPAAAVDGRADGKSYALVNTAVWLAIIGYCVVAAVLALRLCAGVGFALRLRNQAERVLFPFDPDLDTRVSMRLATPVTIGSSVLLPKTYTLWDGATLRIVLSHERAHVRQKDFYVQTLARLHCALFWFNPFSWWLQRQLSELGEALSDCAAVEQAESRASYAETLLAFATRDPWPMSGVAMAGASNLRARIERLLNDQGFERSFAPRQRLPFIAAAVVLVAMVASTSVVRHAAASDGTSTSAAGHTNVKKDLPDAAENVDVDNVAIEEAADVAAQEADRAAQRAADEEVLAIRSGHSHIVINAGAMFAMGAQQSGDYIYFQHNGKPYVIQDPAILAKAESLLAPMKQLSEKQKELGHEQRLLGEQQRMLASQRRALKLVQTPDFKREMDELQRKLKEVDLPRLSAQIDERALAEVQAHLGEIQTRVGQLQAEFGLQGHQFGEEMSKFGEQQGKLGEQQALLGEQQRKIVEETTRQLKPMIEQAIREGKGKPLSSQ